MFWLFAHIFSFIDTWRHAWRIRASVMFLGCFYFLHSSFCFPCCVCLYSAFPGLTVAHLNLIQSVSVVKDVFPILPLLERWFPAIPLSVPANYSVILHCEICGLFRVSPASFVCYSCSIFPQFVSFTPWLWLICFCILWINFAYCNCWDLGLCSIRSSLLSVLSLPIS